MRDRSKLIYTSFSPNTRPRDLVTNIVTILFPWTWLTGNYPDLIKSWFENRFSAAHAFTFNYARSGMYILFKALGFKEGDEVVVQGYTCSAAVNPVLWAGLRPIYADINKNTANLDIESVKKTITPNTKAVMFQHTYGNSTGIEETKQICRQHNLLLIEDCANTILGRHKNKLIGSFGDAAIFSFGRDKAISGVDGGLILINNHVFLKNFGMLCKNLTYPGFSWVAKELFYPINWFFIKMFYDNPIGKTLHLVLTVLGILTRATSDKEKRGKITKNIPTKLPNALAKLAYTQLVDMEKINDHRKNINDIYRRELSDIHELGMLEYEEQNILLRFPVMVKDKNQLESYLKARNIYVGNWYDAPITPINTNLETFGYKEGMCKVSEEVCEKVINLPNHINIDQKDAMAVVETIKRFYAK